MSGKNNSGEKPEDNGLGLNNNTPPVRETAGTGTPPVGAAAGTGTPGGSPPPSGGAGEKKDKPNLKMGLERYLQNFPKNSGITALLRLKNKADVKTIPEWEAVIKELLHKKIQ